MRGTIQLAKLKRIWRSRKEVFLPLVLIGVGLFYLLTIREGHDWGGDFSMYLQHAENLATGRPYSETPFVQVPEIADAVGPSAYPPVFPVALAPVFLARGGPDLGAMKAVVVVFFVLFLLAVAAVLDRRSSRDQVALLVVLVGASPYFWGIKDQVLSDIPFACFIYLTLWLAEMSYADSTPRSRRWGLSILVGLTVYLATGTRSLGLALVPALMLYEALRFRKLPLHALASSAIAFTLLAVQRAVVGVTGSPLTSFRFDPIGVMANFFQYAFSLKNLFWNGYINGVAVVVWLAVSALAVYGFRLRLRAGYSLLEIFTVVYLIPVLLWPYYQGIRFLIPIVPLYFYYALAGFSAFRTRLAPPLATRAAVAIGAAVFGSYIAGYSRTTYTHVSGGISEEGAVALFDYLRANRRDSDVYVFFKPRVLAYFARARSAMDYQTEDRAELWDYYGRVGATHLIVREGDGFWEERVRAAPSRFVEVYRNPDFSIYQLAGTAVAPDAGDYR